MKLNDKSTDSETESIFEKILYFRGILTLGFLIFEILFVHAGYFISQTINSYTLPITYILFTGAILLYLFLTKSLNFKNYKTCSLFFIAFSLVFFLLAKYLFSQTYDTSWDGNGYHSSGVISFANNWNPIQQTKLPVRPPDPGIFVNGYPSALWLIQGSIYSTIGTINSSKVTNLIAL